MKTESNMLLTPPFNELRSLIDIGDDIIGGPFDGKMNYFYCIASENYFTLKKLKEFTEIFNLKLVEIKFMSRDDYLKCIDFTLTVKLSPRWCRINEYFFKSENFCFENTSDMKSIGFKLSISKNCINIDAKGLQINLRILTLNDLGINFDILNKEKFVIISKRVCVMPYLNEATAFAVYLKLPSGSPFKNYSELKSYWKLLHGLSLPESEEGIAYVEVVFSTTGFTYIYPIICVCQYESLQCKPSNQYVIMDEFKEDFKKYFKMLWHSFKFNIGSEKENSISARN